MNTGPIAITGASGYLGSRLDLFFSKRDLKTIRLERNPQNTSSRKFDLHSISNNKILEDTDILIHCAYDFNCRTIEESHTVNYLGTKLLFDIARNSNVKKIIYISSISAVNNSNSNYGREKLNIEKLAKQYNATIIRPAFIISRDPGGMFKRIINILSTNIFVPYFPKYIPFYITYEDELLNFIYQLISFPESIPKRQTYSAFNDSPIDFSFFLKCSSKSFKFFNIFIPFSTLLILYTLKFLERLRFNIGFSSDSFFGLINGHELYEQDDFNTNYYFSKFK